MTVEQPPIPRPPTSHAPAGSHSTVTLHHNLLRTDHTRLVMDSVATI